MNTPSEREFCSRCRSINLKDTQSHPERIRPKYGVEVAKLGEPEFWDMDECPLCYMFYSTISSRREPGTIYDNYNLYAFTSPTTDELGISWDSELPGTGNTTTLVLLRLMAAEVTKHFINSATTSADHPDKRPNEFRINFLTQGS